MTRRSWALVGLGVGLLAAGTAWIVAPSVIRSKLESAAARADATVVSAEISVGFKKATVHTLVLAPKHAPHLQVSVDQIEVNLGWTLRPERVEASGLHVVARGSWDELVEDARQTLDSLRDGPAQGNSSSNGSSLRDSVAFTGASFRWEGAFPWMPMVEATGVELRFSGKNIAANIGHGELSTDRAKVTVQGGHVVFEGSPSLGNLRALNADAVDLELSASAVASAFPPAPSPAPRGSASAAPSTALLPKPGRKKVVPAVASAPAQEAPPAPEPPESVAPSGLGRLAPLSQRARALSLEVSPVLAALPPLGTKALRVTIPHDGAPLVFGPSEATIERRADATVLEIAAVPDGQGTPLSFVLRLPDRADDPISLDLRGGPVPLSLLMRDPAAFHLVEPARSFVEVNGTLLLSPDAKELSWKGSASVQGLNIDHKKIATSVVRGLGIKWSGELSTSLDLHSIKIPKASISSSGVSADISGDIERSDEQSKIQLKINVPLASCQAVIDGLPKELIPLLVGSKMLGTFSAQASVRFDSKNLAATDVGLSFLNECKFAAVPAGVEVSRFRGPITRSVYHPDGTRYELVTGPGTPTWVPYTGISHYMVAAVQMTEDGAFFRHRGMDFEAIRNSIRDNLNEGKFKRGASTISMQTAKNLDLDREKTISRKLQEALLTTYLEQTLSKEQILELYLNNIEFAPNVYGIGPAAAHYFRTYPSALSLGQALYISSILPNPKVQHFGPGGRVSPGWMSLLHKWMKSMYRLHLIEEDDLREGAAEYVVFGQPKPERAQGADSENPDNPDLDRSF
ncbi:MAG: biosynthetic peptidoglycan transglycosylase [Polyangiaceae bacterium]